MNAVLSLGRITVCRIIDREVQKIEETFRLGCRCLDFFFASERVLIKGDVLL